MRRGVLFALMVWLSGNVAAIAQGDTEHLRGTVTNIAGTTITIRTTENETRTIAVDTRTMIMRGNAHLEITGVRVGDRVVVDVDRKTSTATSVELGTAAPAPTPRQAPSSSSQPPPAESHQHEQAEPSESGWHFMQDAVVYGTFNHQGGPRGDNEFVAQNWYMGMASRNVGTGTLTLNGMFSLDPATVGKSGYAEIFQVGETFEGRPLVDRQHPHDFFMQLAAIWRTPLTPATGVTIAGGLAGEPALGPVAFMHRASALDNPMAPLSHHIFDSTHISFGVLTGAIDHGPWLVEASVFNGREPDEHRWDFDFGKLDSISGRVWYRPNPVWEFQVSTGHLNDPEELEPGDIQRTTASASWTKRKEMDVTAMTVAYGVNVKEEGGSRHAVLGEATKTAGRTSVFGRFEVVQVETSALLGGPPASASGITLPPSCPSLVHCLDSLQRDTLAAFTVGGVRDVIRSHGVEAGLGAAVSFYAVPDALRATHGDHPVSFQIFFRLRPKGERMWNMRMSQPMSGHQMGATSHHD